MMWHWGVQAIGTMMVLQAIQPPAPTGRINDFANVLSLESESAMSRIVEDVLAKSGGEIAVVTIADIGPRAASDWGLEIGRQWGVGARGNPGDRARNTGVIVLLVPKETNSSGRGECRIEVGQGSEGFITDAMSGTICREATPLFARGDYSSGLTLVTARVAERFATEFGFQLDTAFVPRMAESERVPSGVVGGFSPGTLIFLFFIVMLVLQNFGGRGRRRRRGRGGCLPIFIPMGGGGFGGHRGGGWGGGGGGFGGFGGFGGGGGFSGGGGGSSW